METRDRDQIPVVSGDQPASQRLRDPTKTPSRPKSRLQIAIGLAAILAILWAGRTIFDSNSPRKTPAEPGTVAAPTPRPVNTEHRLTSSRKVIERNGKTLLWAQGDQAGDNGEWFDMSDSEIDPRKFNHGIGKDRIRAIEQGVFASIHDPAVAKAGINESTEVWGYENGGDARAYPIGILNEHELVNDTVGGKPVTVGW